MCCPTALKPLFSRAFCCLIPGHILVIAAFAEDPAAWVNYAPDVNGTVTGDILQTQAESRWLNSGAVIHGVWQVPGTPQLFINGSPDFGGLIEGTGNEQPSHYQIGLNQGSVLDALVIRTDPQPLPSVSPPQNPSGTRHVNLNHMQEDPGDFSTLRNLTLNSNAGIRTIPPGVYGDFTANDGSGFRLGETGAMEPALYHFQRLTLNSGSVIELAGPVIIHLRHGTHFNGPVGEPGRCDWLELRVSQGGVTLNSGTHFYGRAVAPAGAIQINSNAEWHGSLVSDRLTINSGGLLQYCGPDLEPPLIEPPQAFGAAYETPRDTPIPFTLEGEDPQELTLSFVIKTLPSSGDLMTAGSSLIGEIPFVLEPEDQPLTFVPHAGFLGQDSFSFLTHNGSLESEVAVISLEVVFINTPPLAFPQTIFTYQNHPAPVGLTGFDPDGHPLSFYLANLPSHGLLVGAAPSLTYFPAPGFSGEDSFGFLTFDGFDASPTAQVNVVVERQNQPPIAHFDWSASEVQAPFAVLFEADESSDPDGHIVSYSWRIDGMDIAASGESALEHPFSMGGFFEVTLMVEDNEGARASTTSLIWLNRPPGVALRSFEELGGPIVGEPFLLQIDSTDPDGNLERIDLFVDGVERKNLTPGHPRNVLMPELSAGWHQIQARAVDQLGVEAWSQPLVVDVGSNDGLFVIEPNRLEVELTLTRAEAAARYVAWNSRDHSEIVSFSWTDIQDTSEELVIVSNSTDAYEEVALGFSFMFYGVEYNSVFVSTNGLVSFGEGFDGYVPGPLPVPYVSPALVAALWADLNPAGYYGGYGNEYEGGAIYFQDFGDRAIVQYTSVPSYGAWWEVTMQVVLHADGVIELFYLEGPDGVDAYTVGIQNHTGDDALELSHGSVFVANEFAVRIEHAPLGPDSLSRQLHATNGYALPVDYHISVLNPETGQVSEIPADIASWLEFDPALQSLESGGNAFHEVTFSAVPGLSPGVHSVWLRVDHSQPDLEPYFIEAVLHLVQREPWIQWSSPDSEVTYLLQGDELSLSVDAWDDDGAVLEVRFFINGEPLESFFSKPYATTLPPAVAGNYEIQAWARDDEGLETWSDSRLVFISLDSDGDGLPDRWELDQLGTLAHGSMDDLTGDGVTLKKAFVHGLDPMTFLPPEAVPNLVPEAHVTHDNLVGEVPLSVAFDASASFDRDGSVIAFEWMVDSGDIAGSEPLYSPVFTEPGIYRIRLRVSDDSGAWNEVGFSVHAKAEGTQIEPVAEFTADRFAGPTAFYVTFDAAASSDEDGFIESYSWDFGDGHTGSGEVVRHVFTEPGIREVQLTVADNEGLFATATHPVMAIGPPAPVFFESGGICSMEAEDYSGWRGGFAPATEGFMNISASNGLPDEFPMVHFVVEIETPGLYSFALLRTAPSGGSIQVFVDGEELSPPQGWVLGGGARGWGRGPSLGFLDIGRRVISLRTTGYTNVQSMMISVDRNRLPPDGASGWASTSSLVSNPRPRPPVAEFFHNELVPTDGWIAFDAQASSPGSGSLLAFDWTHNRFVDYWAGYVQHVAGSSGSIADFQTDGDAFHGQPDSVELTVWNDHGLSAKRFKSVLSTDPLPALFWPSGWIIDNVDPAGFGYWPKQGEVMIRRERSRFLPGLPGSSPLEVEFTFRFEGIWGDDFVYTSGSSSHFRFDASGHPSGSYLVFARWPDRGFQSLDMTLGAGNPDFGSGLNLLPDGAAKATIRDAEGERVVRLDQRYRGGRWICLGLMRLDAGHPAHIDISGSRSGHAMADAVWLAPVAGSLDAFGTGFSSEPSGPLGLRVGVELPPDLPDPLVAWIWEFGDGTQLRSPSAAHRYAEAGSYPVSLTVVDAAGRVGRTTQVVEVEDRFSLPPSVHILASSANGHAPLAVRLDALIDLPSERSLEAVRWFIGGRSAYGPTVDHVFSRPGLHRVRVEVEDSHGHVVEASTWIEVRALGEIFGESLVVTSQGRVTVEGIWQTVEATESIGQRVLRSETPGNSVTFQPGFGGEGLYQVYVSTRHPGHGDKDSALRLTIAHAHGVSHTVVPVPLDGPVWHLAGAFHFDDDGSAAVTMEHPPDVPFIEADAVRFVRVGGPSAPTFTAHSEGLSVDFLAFASDSAPELEFKWDFGDGATAEGMHVQHEYSLAGPWVVRLTARTSEGASSTMRTIHVTSAQGPPTVDFEFLHDSANAGLVYFNAIPTATGDRIVSWLWSFGDGGEGSGIATDHRFRQSGSYEVTLIAVDAQGGEGLLSRTVEVDVPIAPLLPAIDSPIAVTGDPPYGVIFEAPLANVPEGTRFFWSFGDGETAEAAVIHHTYAGPGVYRVVLTMELPNGDFVHRELWAHVGTGEDLAPWTDALPPSSSEAHIDPLAPVLIHTPLQ